MKLKKRLLALALTLVLLFAIVPAAYADSGFKDIPDGAWYEDAAVYCKENGLMKGVTDTEFYPSTIVTRGMVVTVLYRMAGEPIVSGDMPFTDVGIHSYCAKAVIWASENGITLGFEDNTFRPDLEINREQFACLIGRFATAVDAPFLYGPEAEFMYSDIDSVSEFALDGVQIVRKAAIMLGYGGDYEFRPTSLTDRAQASVVFMRLHKLLTIEMPDCITVNDDNGHIAHSYMLMKEDAAALKAIFAGMEKSDLYAEFISTHDITLGDTTYRFAITDSSKLPDYCGFITSGDPVSYGGYFDNSGKLAEVYKIMAKYIEL